MPHFENLDQFEAVNPKSGKKEIVPIAPSSAASYDYKPVRTANSRQSAKHSVSELSSEEDLKMVSVKQMEREFRQASRAAGDPIGFFNFRKLKRLIRKILRKLLGNKKPKARRRKRNPQQNRNRNSSNQNRQPQRRRNQQHKGPKRDNKAEQGSPQKKRQQPKKAAKKNVQQDGRKPKNPRHQRKPNKPSVETKANSGNSDQGTPAKKSRPRKRNRSRNQPNRNQSQNRSRGRDE